MVSQARLDVRTVLDELSGKRAPAFSTRASPLPRPVDLREIDPIAAVLPSRLAERYSALRRDLAMVGAELRGVRPPVVVPRRNRAVHARDRGSSPRPRSNSIADLRTFRVVRVLEETDDARTFEIVPIDGAPFQFTPGQFLVFHVDVDGRSHRRAYSISSSPTKSTDRDTPSSASGPPQPIRFTVKRIASGKVSGHLVETLREGASLRARGPSGAFVLPPASGPRSLLFVAGGSGITPIASILRTVLAEEPTARATLIYGNRSERDVIFRDELERLAVRYAERFRLVHVLSDPATDAPCVRGMPTRETLTEIFRSLSLLETRPGEEAPHCFSCGPAPMLDAVRAAWTEHGMPRERLVEERFSSLPDPAGTPRASSPQIVTIRARDGARSVTVRPEQTVLEAALAAGVPLPFSCQMGGCGACRCEGSGALAMDEPNCLTAEERAAGLVLTCVARALGPAEIRVAAPMGARS